MSVSFSKISLYKRNKNGNEGIILVSVKLKKHWNKIITYGYKKSFITAQFFMIHIHDHLYLIHSQHELKNGADQKGRMFEYRMCML